MNKTHTILAAFAVSMIGGGAVLAQGGGGGGQANQGPPPPMTFFVTSTVPGTGNLGGLAGADRICQNLAAAAGQGNRTWRAYLSAQAQGGQPAVNARDRIGTGPWHNAKGERIAANVADLHGDNERDRNYLYLDTALDEKGNTVTGRVRPQGAQNEHDILTGSDSMGRALPGPDDKTCRNWTSEGEDGKAMLGHHDRSGGGNTSWNAAHLSRNCTKAGLNATGGTGRFYCFAAN